ncbi:MAG: hypothetical protein ACJ8D6_03760, partial [Sphingomicrobium sp.]
PESAPAEAPPAETADEAAPPAKPARKRRGKAAAEPAPAETVPVPAANNDEMAEAEEGAPRRSGWWQKTFG